MYYRRILSGAYVFRSYRLPGRGRGGRDSSAVETLMSAAGWNLFYYETSWLQVALLSRSPFLNPAKCEHRRPRGVVERLLRIRILDRQTDETL
ncbi:unnamed protein product [Arctogadus glacialis]